MEVMVVGAFFTAFLPKLWEVIDAGHTRRYQIETYISSIQYELPIWAASIRDHELQCIGRPKSEESQKIIQKARRLAQGVDDCICRFLMYQTGGRIGKQMTHKSFELEIKQIKEQVDKMKDEVLGLTSTSMTNADEPQDLFNKHEFVGMGVTIEELVELLGCVMPLPGKPSTKIGKGKLKVISIVGIGGSGKTRLAEEVREKVGDQFGRQGIFTMGLDGDLKTVLDYVNLDKKSYLIVIDDVRSKAGWDTLMQALTHGDWDVSNRIIVTTTSQPVAEHCSSRGGHVYKMTALSYEHSEELLWKAIGREPSVARRKGLSRLVKICDGLPLAVIESAEPLKTDVGACQEAIRKLSTPEGTLTRMQWVLMKEYICLASYGARACLLYFHMFPSEIQNKSKFLTRRWLAEGLVQRDDPKGTDLGAALNYLRTFRDGNIIRSMEVGNDDTVKSCRLTGTMHEFISRQSISQDFIRFLTNNGDEPDKNNTKYVRRLSLHAGAASLMESIAGVDLSLLRTLAVSGVACEAITDFSKYTQLLVLDLKEWDYHQLCEGKQLQYKLEDIWKLAMLKYLGLPHSIGEVPKKIERLKNLETLDLDVVGTVTTETVKVYTEVIKLPKLKHLLGKFRLSTRDTYKNGIPKYSSLETFSGFVNNGKGVFPKLMTHMNKLRKVKMWCDSKAKEEELNHVCTAIQDFISLGSADPAGVVRSLSIDVEGCQVHFLDSLKATGNLTKLKLHGSLNTVPEFITALDSLTELCLSSTTLCKKRPPSDTSPFPLQGGASLLPYLIYLKLVDDDLGHLKILKQHFESLERLCLMSKTRISNITIDAGALQSLVSLHVICEHLVDLAGIQIGGLVNLKEIALDSNVSQKTKDAWKAAARGHPNQPQVLVIDTRYSASP